MGDRALRWLSPATTACFVDDLEALLAHLKLPPRHRINLRTTDLIERSFIEERRRTKVIPRFTDEKSVKKLNWRRSSEHRRVVPRVDQ